jgi:hypothetical protein
LEEGATNTAKYFVAFLDNVKQQLTSKRAAKLRNVIFLSNNSAPQRVVIVHQKLGDLHFEVLKRPAYSPDLASLDYCHLPNLKKHLKERKFSSTEEVTLAADRWFAAPPNEFF